MSKSPPDFATEMIVEGEGYRPHAYRCPLGHLTIGYGTKLPLMDVEMRALGLDPESALQPHRVEEWQAKVLLRLRLLRMWGQLTIAARQDYGVNVSDQAELVQCVLADMVYNLGVNGLLKFKRMWAALAKGDRAEAAREAEDSKWYGQVGHRGFRNVKLLEGLDYING